MYRHGEDGIAQRLHQRTNGVVVRHTNPHLFSVLIDLRQLTAGREDKGERPRQVFLHQFEGRIADLRIFADIREVVADDWQIAFLRVDALDLTNTLDRPHIQRITTHRIHRVGGIDDKAPVSQDVDDLVYLFLIWILWIYFDQHNQP